MLELKKMELIKTEIIRELSKHRNRRDQQCLRSFFYLYTDFANSDIDKAIIELAEDGKVLIRKSPIKEIDDIIILLWRQDVN